MNPGKDKEWALLKMRFDLSKVNYHCFACQYDKEYSHIICNQCPLVLSSSFDPGEDGCGVKEYFQWAKLTHRWNRMPDTAARDEVGYEIRNLCLKIMNYEVREGVEKV